MTCRVRYSRGMLAALFLPVLASCSLPFSQLSLPSPINDATGADPMSRSPRKTGTALSDPAAPQTLENRTFAGSGQFVNLKPNEIGRKAGGSSGGATSSSSAEGISINLVGASVPEVAKTVLGDVLGVNYSVSEKVKATITLRTANPVDKDVLLKIFESVLRAEGIAVIVDNGLYKIVPSAEAANAGAPLRRKSSPPGGISASIISLRYVAAPEMERILKSVAPQATLLRVDTNRNLLVVSGTDSEIASVMDMVSVFDVDYMRGMSFGIYPVETSDPEAIAQELDTIFANDRDGPAKGLVRFVGNKRLKAVLVISPRAEYLKKAEMWISRIDVASRATEKQVFVYKVQNRPALELAPLLQRVYGVRGGGGASSRSGSGLGSDSSSSLLGGGGAQSVFGGLSGSIGSSGSSSGSAGNSSIATPNIQAVGSGGQSGGNSATTSASAGPVTDTGQPSVASLDSTRPGTSAALPPDDRGTGISIVPDEANNSLVITATAKEFQRMRRILQSIDIAPNQVMIEATIAEVTLNDDLKFGIRWFFQQRANSVTFTDAKINPVDTVLTGGFSYLLKAPNIKVALEALSSVTNTDVISSPTLTVVENKKAQLQVGDEVPILSQQAVSVVGGQSPIVNSVSYRNTGVILNITPRVSDDGRIVMDIEQEVSAAVATSTGVQDSPTIQQRRVKTTVNVNDGESIVLAGLVRDNSSRTRDQVPILGDISILGNAFKRKDDSIARTELMIAITPHIIRDSYQLDQVTAEFRDKLNFSTRPQRKGPPDAREQLDRIIR